MKNSSGFNCEPRSIKSKVILMIFFQQKENSIENDRQIIEKRKFKESVTAEADEPTSLSGLLMKSRRFIDEPA